MSKTIINLTQQTMLQEIERVLEQCPHHPHQQAFAHPDLRQQLLVWVLNRVPNVFTLLEDPKAIHRTDALVFHNQQSCTEYVIRQGIQEVLLQNQQAIEHCLPDEEDARLSASHWFG